MKTWMWILAGVAALYFFGGSQGIAVGDGTFVKQQQDGTYNRYSASGQLLGSMGATWRP